MKKVMLMLLMSAVGMVGTCAWAGSARQDSVARLDSSVDVLHAIMATPDKGIPEEVLSNAKCILVVPNMIKGGFIFGGKHGRGVATCRTAEGWSAPAFVSIGGGSAGFQIGLEGVDLVMLIMNDQGFQHLLSSKFELTGEGSVAAGPVGRHAYAGTDWKMKDRKSTRLNSSHQIISYAVFCLKKKIDAHCYENILVFTWPIPGRKASRLMLLRARDFLTQRENARRDGPGGSWSSIQLRRPCWH